MENHTIENQEKLKTKKTKIVPKYLRPFDRAEKNKQNEQKEPQKIEKQFMKKFQGDIGERSCIQIATKKMGWKPELNFEQTSKGFDGVFRDDKNNLVIVESKVTEKNAIHSLKNDQMSISGIERVAKKMQDPSASDYYTPRNSEIGKEIIRNGPEKVHRFVFWLEPKSLQWTIFEANNDNSWKKIETFTADNPDFDGPYIHQ